MASLYGNEHPNEFSQQVYGLMKALQGQPIEFPKFQEEQEKINIASGEDVCLYD